MYDFLLTVHVLAAILWVGGGVTIHILFRRALRLTDPRATHESVRELEWVGQRFYPGFSLFLLVAGILLVTRDEGGFEFSDTFGASIRRTAMVNSFELLILLLVVVDMTTKPGWP
jgi:uncharacterized membrane protein